MSSDFLYKDGTLNQNAPIGLDDLVSFTDEELEKAKQFLEGKDFKTKEGRGYFGPDKQYYGFTSLQVQVESPKADVLFVIIRILQPRYYVDVLEMMDDKPSVHPALELLKRVSTT